MNSAWVGLLNKENPTELDLAVMFWMEEGEPTLVYKAAEELAQLRSALEEAEAVIERDADEDGHHYSDAASEWIKKWSKQK